MQAFHGQVQIDTPPGIGKALQSLLPNHGSKALLNSILDRLSPQHFSCLIEQYLIDFQCGFYGYLLLQNDTYGLYIQLDDGGLVLTL